MEIRIDPITNRKVIVSHRRANRPSDFVGTNKKICPFCPGNEYLIPKVECINDKDRGRIIKIVQNKYPIIDKLSENYLCTELFCSESGYGVHEVVIESEIHNDDYESMDLDHIEQIFKIYIERITYYFNDKMIQYISILKNSGKEAGATLEHPHSQIVALSITPSLIEDEINGSKKYYLEHHSCVYCDIIVENLKLKERIVLETEYFVCYIPYAGIQSYEVIIIPKRHESNFECIEEEEIKDLAFALKKIYKKFKCVLGEFPYNLTIHTGPREKSNIKNSYHYHIRLTARLIELAKYELGATLYVRDTTPEEIAKILREV